MRKTKLTIFLAAISLVLFGMVGVASAAVENLDEIVARRARMANATWGPNNMENPTTRIWQPETLMYQDVVTGHEVWRMSSTKDLENVYHDDIGWPQWSADGKWLAFASDRTTNAYSKTNSAKTWFLTHTDGSYLMPVVGGSTRRIQGYFHWSPQVPDTYYDVGDSYNGLTLNRYDLYKNTVSDAGVTRSLLFTTNTGGGNTKAKILSKTISGDGQKILLRDVYNATGPYSIYPCTVYPDASAGCSDPRGYSMDRGQGIGWGNMPASYNYEHGGGLFLSGNSATGYSIYMLPSGTSVWWRMALTGSASDGGPLYTDPGTSGEVVVESTGTATPPPYSGHDYWSHMTPDWWGTHVVFSASDSATVPPTGQPGIAHINAVTHTYDTRSFLNAYGVQHNDWHGFTDYTVSSYTPYPANDYLAMRITSQKYNDATKTDIATVNYTHTRYNGGTSYNTLPRPAESPDGTKVMWTSEFLNASPNKNDIFWSVVRYPYPPVNLSAAKNGSSVRLSWSRPAYTARGWPNEQTDPPPTSKEIKGYHVWSSANGTTGWAELTTTAITTEYYDIAQSNSSTRYYAVTSEEYSRLESRELSAILRVVLDVGGGISISQFAPEGQIGFWTTPPSAPVSLSSGSTGTAGQYQLDWTEPNNSKIRYYHIYYSTSNNPQAIQQQRIASVPAGTNTYLDWLADPAQSGYYGITSVDRYGNESGLALANQQVDTTPPSAPTGLTVN